MITIYEAMELMGLLNLDEVQKELDEATAENPTFNSLRREVYLGHTTQGYGFPLPVSLDRRVKEKAVDYNMVWIGRLVHSTIYTEHNQFAGYGTEGWMSLHEAYAKMATHQAYERKRTIKRRVARFRNEDDS